MQGQHGVNLGSTWDQPALPHLCQSYLSVVVQGQQLGGEELLSSPPPPRRTGHAILIFLDVVLVVLVNIAPDLFKDAQARPPPAPAALRPRWVVGLVVFLSLGVGAQADIESKD